MYLLCDIFSSAEKVGLYSLYVYRCVSALFFWQSSESNQDDAVTQALSDNYNRAEFIRDRLIPRAVLFFTGEAIEDDEVRLLLRFILHTNNMSS